MKRENSRALIVDDDITFARVIKQAFDRANYEAECFQRPAEALEAARQRSFPILVIDCMLPKMHGVDLAVALRELGCGSGALILMSGIFRDKTFIKEAQQKTEATAFLTKPFDLSELIAALPQAAADGAGGDEQDPLIELITHPQASAREVRKAIESLELVDGNHLPFLFCLIMDIGLSGHLNIISESGTVSGVTFCEGRIQAVDVPDKTTFLGALLVELGYLTPSALQQITARKSERLLGSRLVEENLLSPHALPIALSQQMILRLGKTVEGIPARINFVLDKVVESPHAIDLAGLIPYLHEWLFSKIKLDWIKSFYNKWLDHRIVAGPHLNKTKWVEALPVYGKIPRFFATTISGQTLSHLLNSNPASDDLFLRALHLAVVLRMLSFDSKGQTADMNEQAARIKRLSASMQGKNLIETFELLGVTRNAKGSEIQKVYRDFSKVFHPDRVGVTFPPELAPMVTEVFSRITRAYKILTDEQAKENYLKELSQGEARKHFHAEEIFEQGKGLLKRAHFRKAVEAFEKCCKTIDPTTEMRLYLIWATLKLIEIDPKEGQRLQAIETEMTAVPPEDRHSALYFFVKGIYERTNNRVDLAIKNLERSIALDPNFLNANRELMTLRKLSQSSKKSQNVLNADLSEVVSSLFRKKA